MQNWKVGKLNVFKQPERLNLLLVCDDMIHERSPDLGEWDAGHRELDSDGQWDYWARAEGGAGPGCLDGTVQD